ncbi:MAG: hypothetical protein ACTHNP_07535 [Solirubrobacterales bacterium]
MGILSFTQRWWQGCLLFMFVAGMVLFCGPASRAIAQEAHVFDPTLSLTGNCSTSSVDQVPDPGLCPGVAGVDHPSAAFRSPRSVATDSYGNIFVANYGQDPEGTEGRIDIFDSKGFFVTEVAALGPMNVAVDSQGNLYVINAERELLRFSPSLYEPATAEISYEKTPATITGGSLAPVVGLAVNPLNDHVFIYDGQAITELKSAAESNEVIDGSIGKGTLSASQGIGLAIDASRGRIYASDQANSGKVPDPSVVKVFELNAPHALVETIDGASLPAGKFIGLPSIAVEELTGHVFTYEAGTEVVYELTETGHYIATVDHELQGHFGDRPEISVDNGKHSPNGKEDPFGGSYLFVPAYNGSPGHTLAFGPPQECAPEIMTTSFTGTTETEALLQAEVNPCNLQTSYRFEYTPLERYEEEGFSGALVAGEGQIPAGFGPVPVSAAAEGLEPGAAYRFRVVATNELGSDEGEETFRTYPASEPQNCPNEGVRTGLSALLPDCRAYELVTPPDTNGRAPLGVDHLGTYFPTRESSPAGSAVSFEIEGGALPGSEATGSFAGDPYLASRTATGWSTSYAGPSASEAPVLLPGSTSPDQGFSFWSTGGGQGSAAVEENTTTYLRYPDGHAALVGRGSIGTDPRAVGKLISENGGHVVFTSGGSEPAIQLEPNAPPSGTSTIYDRTIDTVTGEEETHVVSLLPGNVTPAEGENASYLGASLNGKGVAFSIGKKLYLRFDDEETYEVGENVTFAGVAEGGARIFYLEGGDLFAFDAEAEETVRFTETGDVTPVNVAAEGTAAYFVSPTAIASGPNPNGATPQAGEENLYLSREGSISFVGTVTERDVAGEGPNKSDLIDGLGLWVQAVNTGRLGKESSRTTPDGEVLLFESRAALAGYDPEGHAEVYRYDSGNDELSCLSCIPTLAPAGGQASLESVSLQKGNPEPFSSFAFVDNLSADGRRAFFQSTEPLVARDNDGLQDVYEWEAQGAGSCGREGGCVYLISSGHSPRINYLYAVSDGGNDVFFRASDLLLPSDTDETPSLYDARVEGGFPERRSCDTSFCPERERSAPPVLTTPASPSSGRPGNVSEGRHCPKGTRKAIRKGKTRCVRHHRHHRKVGSKQKGGNK